MKTKIFISLLMLFSTTIFSKNQPVTVKDHLKNTQGIEQLIQQYLRPKAVGNSFYDEFNFSSNQGALFNQYSGHTMLDSIGGDNLNFHNLYWGFNFYNITTETYASSNLNSTLTQSHGSIEDNGVYLHVMKEVFFPVFVDVFASMGRDRFKQGILVNANTPDALPGITNYYGNDGTVGIRTFFGQSYNSFYVQGDIDYFYSVFNQPDYLVMYPGLTVAVPSLTTKIGTFIENARLYYNVNEHFSPFVSGGLLQIASRTFSRPVVDPNFIAVSALPQLLLDKNGYSYGVGFDYHCKALRITPAYVHTVRGSNYHDDAGGITIEINGLS